jgi:hypothetical protein
MSDNIQRVKGRVRLYACGGGGLNIGSNFETHRNKSDAGFADIDVVYIDTSMSNLNQNISLDHTYLLQGLDGSGKVRKENYEEITTRILDILQQHKPGDLNIVLSTAAGGSGSVIAPSLASELLERGECVVVITVGSADTRLEAENTLKTIKSYESIARIRSAPVVMSYIQNDDKTNRLAVDKYVKSIVIALCALFSRENRELDSKDLFNWLHFDKVTTFRPQLAAMSMVEPGESTNSLGNVISVATLITDEGNSKLNNMPEYQCVGYLSSSAPASVRQATPVHFVTSDGVFPTVVKNLETILKSLEESQNARLKKNNILTDKDASTENGLVL